EAVLVLGDRRALVLVVRDAVAVLITNLAHERHAPERSAQRDAHALQDARAAAEPEAQGDRDRLALGAQVGLERVGTVLGRELGRAECLEEDPEDRGRLDAEGGAITELHRADRGVPDVARLLGEGAEVRADGHDLASLRIEDGAEATARKVAAEVVRELA